MQLTGLYMYGACSAVVLKETCSSHNFFDKHTYMYRPVDIVDSIKYPMYWDEVSLTRNVPLF